ncbi:PadR family transcriptional regulator [Kibdelosporangium philippinense]|uniref:PadR family transcriptional regulator n=1 Tax=Kibdelosporangium philippinense TaxID=211113 RepID=UPI0036231D05
MTPLPAEPVESAGWPVAQAQRDLVCWSPWHAYVRSGHELRAQKIAAVGRSVVNFWAFAHSQLYDEPARLVAAGLVTQTTEEGGRRKRTYAITEEGRQALAEWLAEPTLEQTEVRDTGLLKLFFGTGARPDDIRKLARDRYESHRDRADGYLRQRAEIESLADRWQLKTLELGMRYERTVEKFWKDFMEELDRDPP